MILFSKIISSIYSINCFSNEETQKYRKDINRIDSFFREREIFFYHKIDIVNPEDLFIMLSEIRPEAQSGILINFMGHGSVTGFGNNAGIFYSWSDLIPFLQKINSNHDNLIVNTSIMCNGMGLFGSYINIPKPFHAAFGTNTKTNAEIFYRTQQILHKCLEKDIIISAIKEVNGELKDNEDEYEDFNSMAKNEMLDQGIPFVPLEITQFSYVPYPYTPK